MHATNGMTGKKMNTLENLAIGYLDFAGKVPVYNFLIVFAFAIFFGFVKEVNHRMQRGTYFLNSSLILLFGSLSQIVWFFSPVAIANGFVSIFVLFDILVWIASAYSLIIITKSRSNDAYGHPRYAALGFIPIANLWLLFTPSKETNFTHLPAYISGVTAVMIGLVLTGLGRGTTVMIEESLVDYFQNSVDYELNQRVRDRWINYYISNNDMVGALEFMKSLEPIGERIDEITFLNDVVVTSNGIEYLFFITDNSIVRFPSETINALEDHICANFFTFIEGGATVTFNYFSDAVPSVALISSDGATCGI